MNDATKPTRGRKPRSKAHVTGKRPDNRVPLTGRRTRMELNPDELDPNFKYKWVNDQTGLLDKYKSAGYIHVMTDEGITIGQRTVDTAGQEASIISLDVGGGVTAYLMKQPMEFAIEDRQIRDADLDSRESVLMRELNKEKDGTYGEVKIGQERPDYY